MMVMDLLLVLDNLRRFNKSGGFGAEPGIWGGCGELWIKSVERRVKSA